MIVLLLLFSQFCFCERPTVVSTAAMSGLRGSVKSVFTEGFTYGDNDEMKPGLSVRSNYDRTGYETERYEYDSRGLRSQTVYTWRDGHLVKTEIMNPFSKQKSVRLYSLEEALTETDSYDSNGILTAKTADDSSVKKEKSTVSTTRATDRGISTIERFADGSFKESTVKPDGTRVVHAHYRASPQPPLFLPVAGNIYGEWYQTSNANNQTLEFVEGPPTGEYRRISTRYDTAGREVETTIYNRSGKLLGETTFHYLHEDEHGNWLEQQIWDGTESKPAKLYQVTHRTITYYANP
jgi:gamma-glutamyl AIG2-like cyclotransferase